MHVTKLAHHEARVRNGGLHGTYQSEGFSIPVRGENLVLEGRAIAPSSGFQGYFYNEAHPKTKIVLHFTAGVLTGDLGALMSETRGHVSVAFVLARDGIVYRPFSSALWSYHLGRGAQGGNRTGSRESIGVELSNFGPLTLDGDSLRTYTGSVYCSAASLDYYDQLQVPFRGYSYWASYTDEQYDNLIILLRYLTTEFDIPRAFLPESLRFETTPEVVPFSGIVSHVNYRRDKFDLGPGFDWDRVMAGVTAETYESTAARTRGMTRSVRPRSEAEVDRGFRPSPDNDFDPTQYGEDGPDVPDLDEVQLS